MVQSVLNIECRTVEHGYPHQAGSLWSFYIGVCLLTELCKLLCQFSQNLMERWLVLLSSYFMMQVVIITENYHGVKDDTKTKLHLMLYIKVILLGKGVRL